MNPSRDISQRLCHKPGLYYGAQEDSFYSYSPHGDITGITDDAGNARATYGYTAYGSDDESLFTGVDKPDAGDPTAQEPYNAYRYSGQRFDQASGTYDMGFRDYDPDLNRFLTRDTFNGALSDLSLGSNPWTLGRYTFAGGNPTTLVEHDGHVPTCAPDGSNLCPDYDVRKQPTVSGGGGGGAPSGQAPVDPWGVSNEEVLSNGTQLVTYNNGVSAINGYVLPDGHPDPQALAAWVDQHINGDTRPGVGFLPLSDDPVLATVELITSYCADYLVTGEERCSYEFWDKVGNNLDTFEEFHQSFEEFWESSGGNVMTVGTIGAALTCIFASLGWCLVVGGIVAAVGVADAIWKFNRSERTGGDTACLVANISVSVGGVAVPGARVGGKAFWDTPWQHFFERSAAQMGTAGTSETVAMACLQ